MTLAPLLELPTELRLRIYEFTYNVQLVGHKLQWNGRFSLDIRAAEEDKASEENIRIAGSPFTLMRVCRTLHDEVVSLSLLPRIEDLEVHFCNLTRKHAEAWMQTISTEQVAKIRHLKITGWDKCYQRRPMYSEGHRYNCQFGIAEVCTKACNALSNENEIKARSGLCDRSLLLDLTVLERDFDADSWSRYLGEPSEYYGGYDLLRMLDDCVDKAEPKAHPEGFSDQCNSIVDIYQSLEHFVDHDGKPHVTKEAILDLMDCVLDREESGV
ncbi:hypothetical protein AC578_6378 [Pseudocercospora eumusae]|uniref:Uncharacterized protein n=1 Tax=Pseudocercospora eumusae TaxID=321146 RepID=A0A139H0T7_9PEZI|nr:hypothetical protein AC578_6378 [Pseudocercospora eumusae]